MRTSADLKMAYAIDHPIRRRQNPVSNVVLPKYDVKIVAGKRIVIFHEPEAKKTEPEVVKIEPEAEVTLVRPEPEAVAEPVKPVKQFLSSNQDFTDKPKSSRYVPRQLRPLSKTLRSYLLYFIEYSLNLILKLFS